MNDSIKPFEALQDIKNMMERSSRFISLSGWSGISAGLCALAGVWLTKTIMAKQVNAISYDMNTITDNTVLYRQLAYVAVGVFAAAFVSAFFFTRLKAKKNHLSIWDVTAKRLLLNTLLPITAGAFFIAALLYHNALMLVAPAMLVFYGLALVNGSKYTLGEVRYLGYACIVLGLVNAFIPAYGLWFLAAGFGVLHIIYGTIMLWKYEKN
jgi:hypothetical protein